MRILIIEDHALVGRSMQRLFEGRGHEVKVSSSVDFETLPQAPDVVILDRNVEGINGWDLREVFPAETKVVLIAGNAPEGSPEHWVKGKDGPEKLIRMVET